MFVVTVVDKCLATTKDSGMWIVNSGCTHQVTANLSSFKGLGSNYSSKGRLLDVKGKGVIMVETPSSTKLITDVLFVPKITNNLLSVGQLLDKGYALFFLK